MGKALPDELYCTQIDLVSKADNFYDLFASRGGVVLSEWCLLLKERIFS